MRSGSLACAFVSLLVLACEVEPIPVAPRAAATLRGWESQTFAFPLPDTSAPASVDYIAYEPAAARVWVPVGNTGSVVVLDIASHQLKTIAGFKTAERTAHGGKHASGPAAATVGDGFVYIGDRATNEICPIDVKTLRPAACLVLPEGTDAVSYVAPVKEIWVTLHDQSLAIIDASQPDALRLKSTLKVDGDPEGYSVDEPHGLFFTNLEDQDSTLSIDVRTHQVLATWKPGCGKEGPRGIANDPKSRFVFVACTDHLQVLDGAHGGALLGRLETGGGVDNIDYLPSERLLFATSGKTGQLTIAQVDEHGQLAVVGGAPTAPGARSVIIDSAGDAFIPDPRGARLLMLPRAAPMH